MDRGEASWYHRAGYRSGLTQPSTQDWSIHAHEWCLLQTTNLLMLVPWRTMENGTGQLRAAILTPPD